MTLQVGDLIPIGGSGNVKKNEVLSGKIYSSDEGTDLVGTMRNNGRLTRTLTNEGDQFNIPAGYTSGGNVKVQITNLIASNIKKGIRVGNILGSYSGLGADSTLIKETKIRFNGTWEEFEYQWGDSNFLVITNFLGDSRSSYPSKLARLAIMEKGSMEFFRSNDPAADIPLEILHNTNNSLRIKVGNGYRDDKDAELFFF